VFHMKPGHRGAQRLDAICRAIDARRLVDDLPLAEWREWRRVPAIFRRGVVS